MYLYFDRTGALKEIINDEALRQGNYGVNKLYVYVDQRSIYSLSASYVIVGESTAVGPINYLASQKTVTAQIPFDPKRDLLFFKYYTDYDFLVVDLSDDDSNDHSALDQAGTVHCSLRALLEGGTILQLGELNFDVQEDPELNLKYVASQEWLSLSDYKYLVSQFADYVPWEGTLPKSVVLDDGSGNYTVKIKDGSAAYVEFDAHYTYGGGSPFVAISAVGATTKYLVTGVLTPGGSGYKTKFPTDETYAGDHTFATREWALDNLTTKLYCHHIHVTFTGNNNQYIHLITTDADAYESIADCPAETSGKFIVGWLFFSTTSQHYPAWFVSGTLYYGYTTVHSNTDDDVTSFSDTVTPIN